MIWRKLYLALAPENEEAALKEKGFEVVVYEPGDGVDAAALERVFNRCFLEQHRRWLTT